jgi:hypothetical protein
MVHKEPSIQPFNDRAAAYRKRFDSELARLNRALGGTRFCESSVSLIRPAPSTNGCLHRYLGHRLDPGTAFAEGSHLNSLKLFLRPAAPLTTGAVVRCHFVHKSVRDDVEIARGHHVDRPAVPARSSSLSSTDSQIGTSNAPSCWLRSIPPQHGVYPHV